MAIRIEWSAKSIIQRCMSTKHVLDTTHRRACATVGALLALLNVVPEEAEKVIEWVCEPSKPRKGKD